jgi:2-polyprenyl-3-methyl-5-hydroxy-6-metoxy-1,4-benzoquinol methylase
MTQQVVWKTDPRHLHAELAAPIAKNFSDEIAWNDHKIAFVVARARGKDVLDIGCVEHDPGNYQSRFWLHRAIREVAKSVVGLDLQEAGVQYLSERGFDIRFADAQLFDLKQEFDVIVAGDVVTHLEDLHGFFECCRKHLRPDGRLLVSSPNLWHWRNILKAGLRPRRVCTNLEQTLWLCPTTLAQLAGRHGFNVLETRYGSRSRLDNLLPLPEGWRHTSIHAELALAPA